MQKRYGFITLLIVIIFGGSALNAQNNPVIIGHTYGSGLFGGFPGDKIGVDNDGGIHCTWLKYGLFPNPRYVYYNYIDPDGNVMHPGGIAVSLVNGAAFPQLTIAQGDRAAVAYQSTYDPTTENYVVYAVDQFTGFGIFQYFDPPDLIRYRCYWPRLAIDQSEIVHIVVTENAPNAGDPKIIGHTYSRDEGLTWAKLMAIDTVKTVSALIVASPVSENVSIVYLHPADFDDERKNDVFIKQVKYGDNYIDYRCRPVNVTEYGQNNDSLFAFGELDAIYDYSDNLHVIWSAFWVTDAGIYPTEFLYHYDCESGIISHMYDITWQPDTNCQVPGGIFPINNLSMTVIGHNYPELYVGYSIFDENDCSADGYANADVYLQFSGNGGANWSWPFNITLTHTPNCAAGNCHSEVWPSLADSMTEGGFLHLSYIDDRSGGDTVVLNPVYYYKFGPYPVGTFEKGDEVPKKYSFIHNYPNPFNARTTIEFTLAEPVDVELTIYDITGARMETIRRSGLEAGRHSIVWDAEDVASGVYFARMEAGGYSKSIKMVLLK